MSCKHCAPYTPHIPHLSRSVCEPCIGAFICAPLHISIRACVTNCAACNVCICVQSVDATQPCGNHSKVAALRRVQCPAQKSFPLYIFSPPPTAYTYAYEHDAHIAVKFSEQQFRLHPHSRFALGRLYRCHRIVAILAVATIFHIMQRYVMHRMGWIVEVFGI